MKNDDMIQYDNIYDEIRETLLNSRSQAYSAVNFALVQAYWHIGRIIVEHEQDGQERAAYGKAVLQALSVRLTEEFGKGFSVRTLQQMKQFYLTFPNTNALRSQLNWTHYRTLIQISDPDKREYYELEAAKNSLLYERLLKSSDKEAVLAVARKERIPSSPSEVVKDP